MSHIHTPNKYKELAQYVKNVKKKYGLFELNNVIKKHKILKIFIIINIITVDFDIFLIFYNSFKNIII